MTSDESNRIDEAWSAEIARRLQQVRAGTAHMLTWPEARRRILRGRTRDRRDRN